MNDVDHVVLLGVEGAHDVAFFGRILQKLDWSSIGDLRFVPKSLVGLIPRSYPQPSGRNKQNHRLDRVIRGLPEIFIKNDAAVVIGCAEGQDNLLKEIKGNVSMLDDYPAAIGFVFDLDREHPVEQRFMHLRDAIRALGAPFDAAEKLTAPGGVTPSFPRIGLHLFPDNQNPGALEEVLLSVAEQRLPTLHRAAINMVGSLRGDASPYAGPLHDDSKPQVKSKTTASVIGACLTPTASLAVAVAKGDGWCDALDLDAPGVREAKAFLDALLAPPTN